MQLDKSGKVSSPSDSTDRKREENVVPITYEVHGNGHFIHAVAESPLTRQEFVDYEVAHATDSRISTPVSELFEISGAAFQLLSMDDMKEVLRLRGETDHLPTPHRCAIVLDSLDDHSWRLAKFYEGMSMLHSPESVIVFANPDIGRKWIGFDDFAPPCPVR